jgi:hypothetical protein
LHYTYSNKALAKSFDTPEKIANANLIQLTQKYSPGYYGWNLKKQKQTSKPVLSKRKPDNGRWFPVMEGNAIKYVCY